MPKKSPDLSAGRSGPARWRELLRSTSLALSSLLAAYGVVYLLSLPVPLIH